MTSYERISVTPLTPAVGAELGGVDIAAGVDDETLRDIHAALMAHGVVFFRDQDITPIQQRDFAARFGRLRTAKRSAFLVEDGVPEMHVLINDRERPPNVNHYHSDGIFRAEPEFASILRAVEVPEAGGDTIFVGMGAAYDALSDDMKTYLADKEAMHDFMKLHGSPKKVSQLGRRQLEAHGSLSGGQSADRASGYQGASGHRPEEPLYFGKFYREYSRGR